MENSIGIHQAKTQLSKILTQVAQGKIFTITNRGSVVAKIVPPDSPKSRKEAAKEIMRMKKYDINENLLEQYLKEGRK